MRSLRFFSVCVVVLDAALGTKGIALQNDSWEEHLAAAHEALDQKRFEAAEKRLVAALDEVEALDSGDPRLLRALEALSQAFSDVGNKVRREYVLRKIVEVKTEELGPDHADLVSDLLFLEFLQRELLKHAEAEATLKRVIKICEPLLGPDDPETVQTRRELAYLYMVQQKYSEAEELYRNLLLLHEQG
ncbi:MAG: tetratricopeptide repeat protein, partial [Acidobacteria bacterium]|nr:tetratricopeptide repeat protein [Acidobacteriota bacterium]